MDEKYWEIFSTETTTYLDLLENEILQWEEQNNPECLNTIYRYVHTIKGNAGVIGLTPVEELAHGMENVIEKVRQNSAMPDGTTIQTLLENIDWIRRIINNRPKKMDELQAEVQQRLDVLNSLLVTTNLIEDQGPDLLKENIINEVGLGSKNKYTLVNTDKLDQLISLVGEILINSSGLSRSAGDSDNRDLNDKIASLNQMIDFLREKALELRMSPIGEIHQRCRRIIRDLSDKTGKLVEFRSTGGEIEMDKSVIEALVEPLLHIIRNAVDHGIDHPKDRREQNKREKGLIELRNWQSGGFIHLTISDDGSGLNLDKIRRRGLKQGLIQKNQDMTDEELSQLIFHEGFSTAEEITMVSGRGVGLYAVQKSLEAIRGSVSIQSHQGEGTTIELRVPLTLSISRGILISCGIEKFIMPIENVVRCLEVPAEQIETDQLYSYINIDNKPIPLINLSVLFQVEGKVSKRGSLLLLSDRNSQYCLLVSTIEDIIPFVIKPIEGIDGRNIGILGSTILGTGQVALILDAITLIRQNHT